MSAEAANIRVLSTLPADAPAFSIADGEAVARLSRAEEAHFWFPARNRWIATRLQALGCLPPARVLELGCGGGVVAAHLAGLGYRVTGVDGHLPRVREAARRAPRASFYVHDLELGLEGLPLSDADAVGLFDVIEHLDQPARLLSAALTCLRPGGLLVGTVPALMALWSEVDQRSGHRLRYEAPGLAALLGALPGAEIIEVRPFFRALVPLIWAQRRVRRRRPGQPPQAAADMPPSWVNRSLGRLVELERRCARVLDRARLPGASLWFALRRR